MSSWVRRSFMTVSVNFHSLTPSGHWWKSIRSLIWFRWWRRPCLKSWRICRMRLLWPLTCCNRQEQPSTTLTPLLSKWASVGGAASTTQRFYLSLSGSTIAEKICQNFPWKIFTCLQQRTYISTSRRHAFHPHPLHTKSSTCAVAHSGLRRNPTSNFSNSWPSRIGRCQGAMITCSMFRIWIWDTIDSLYFG